MLDAQSTEQTRELSYRWEAARQYAADHKVGWVESWVQYYDRHFAELQLSQAQVDGCMRLAVTHIKHLFSPKTYTLRQRLSIALHFIFDLSGD